VVARQTVFKCDKCGDPLDDSFIRSAGMYDMRYGYEHSAYPGRTDEPIRFKIEQRVFTGGYNDELCNKCLVELLRAAADCIESGGKIEHALPQGRM